MTDTFCPLLFQHLATHPHGGVTHCCIADHREARSSAKDSEERYYNLNRDTVHDTFNSKTFREARLKVLDGKKPQACLRCYAEEAKGVFSKRLEEIKNYSDYTVDVARSVTDENGYIKDLQLEFVELRLGNVCNVACRTCNPASSSKWMNDYKKLAEAEDKGTLKIINRDYFNMGGYNINMTNMNEEIIEIWRQFDHVKVSCSIDDLAERNEYIRHPTKWDDVMRNFLRLKEENFELDVTQTISWMNYSTLGDFYNFFHREHGVWVHHNYVYDPEILSPAVLPKSMRDAIHDKFSNIFPNRKLNELKNMFGGPDNEEKWKRAKHYSKSLDYIRGQKLENILTEFKGMLN